MIKVYSFSSPLSLILPSFISLKVALFFIVVRLIALFKNGVSKMDGSFAQIIATFTGSSVPDRAATGGCLGGNESVPQDLKDLKICFGDFTGRENRGKVKRACLGIEA